MSIGGISSSYSAVETNFWANGLPRLSEEQLAAMKAQLEPVPGASLPSRDFWEQTAPLAESETTRVTGANGASVAVTQHPPTENQPISYTLHLGEGSGQIDIGLSDNAYISKTEAGLYSVYFSKSDVTRTYAADGSFTEVSGDQTDADAGRVCISIGDPLLRGGGTETLQGGNGNDTFLVYGGGSINTGEGDNTVIVKDSSGMVKALSATNEITTGNGNNRVTCDGYYSGTMTLGDGENIVSLYAFARGHILTGTGNSIISIEKMCGSSQLICQRTAAENTERTISIGSMSDGSRLNVYNGKNTVNVGVMSGNPQILLSNCEATLDVGHMSESSRLHCFARSASVTIHDLTGSAWAEVGGNSSVRVNNISGSATLQISNFPGYFLPMGEKYPNVSSEVYVGEMRDSATLTFAGSGHMIAIGAMRDNAMLDALYPENSDSLLVVGKADETAGLPRDAENLYVLSELEQEDLEAVKFALAEWRAEREEAGLSATRRDLWASLNGETNKEEELMLRVALLMSWS